MPSLYVVNGLTDSLMRQLKASYKGNVFVRAAKVCHLEIVLAVPACVSACDMMLVS